MEPMTTSVLFAKVVGLYLLTICMVMLVRREHFHRLIEQFINNDALMMLGSFMGLIIGLLMVITHNVWVMSWPVIITLLGWLILAKALMSLFFPDAVPSLMKAWKHRAVYALTAGVYFIVGLYLLLMAYPIYW